MYLNGRDGAGGGAPLVLGHEMSGLVAEVGPGVTAVKPGARVIVAPNMGCGVCDRCVAGNSHLCASYRALGIHLDGSFAEYVRVPAAAVAQGNIVDLPDSVSFPAGAMVEPLSCVYNAFERSGIAPGDTVLVMGAGPIGLMHARLARMGGAGRVILSDVSADRLGQARRLEESLVVSDSRSLKERVAELTGGNGVDVCITACPAPDAQAAALELTGLNGRVIFFGGLPKSRCPVALDTNLIHYKQLVVTGTARSSPAQYRKSLDLVARGLVKVDDLVTSTWPLEQVAEAMNKVAAGEGLKAAIA
jgi:L-iditol 2-dehydrogenase